MRLVVLESAVRLHVFIVYQEGVLVSRLLIMKSLLYQLLSQLVVSLLEILLYIVATCVGNVHHSGRTLN